jgi:hypothetical protein
MSNTENVKVVDSKGRVLYVGPRDGYVHSEPPARYNIVRMYRDAGIRRRIIKRGVTLEEAQRHCQDPETSSSTCTKSAGRQRTRRMGAWFDGYEECRR